MEVSIVSKVANYERHESYVLEKHLFSSFSILHNNKVMKNIVFKNSKQIEERRQTSAKAAADANFCIQVRQVGIILRYLDSNPWKMGLYISELVDKTKIKDEEYHNIVIIVFNKTKSLTKKKKYIQNLSYLPLHSHCCLWKLITYEDEQYQCPMTSKKITKNC